MRYLGYTKYRNIKITHKLDFWFLLSLKRKFRFDQLAGIPVDQASSIPNTLFNDLIAMSYLTQEYVFFAPIIRNRRIIIDQKEKLDYSLYLTCIVSL